MLSEGVQRTNSDNVFFSFFFCIVFFITLFCSFDLNTNKSGALSVRQRDASKTPLNGGSLVGR